MVLTTRWVVICSALVAALAVGLVASRPAAANPVRIDGDIWGDYPGVGVTQLSIRTHERALCDVKVQLRISVYRGREAEGRRVVSGRLPAVNGCTGEFAEGDYADPTTQRGPWTIVSYGFEFPMQGRARGPYVLCVRAIGRMVTPDGIRVSSHRTCQAFSW